MLKILQVRLQQYITENFQMYKLGLEKQRNQKSIANICWIMEKAREFQKNIYLIDYTKTFDCVDHNKWSNWQTTNLENIQATPTAQLQKNKWPNQKMGQRTK